MRVLTAARVVAVGCAGLYAGILLGDLAGAAQARPVMNPSSFVQLQQIIHARYVLLMPLLVGAVVLASITWLVFIRSRPKGAEFWLVVGTVAGIVFCAVITRLVNVPLNDQLVSWSVAFPPPNVHALWAPWEGAHAIRTVAAVAAFVLSVLALALAVPPPPIVRPATDESLPEPPAAADGSGLP
jgi:uncharacterized membrane protein